MDVALLGELHQRHGDEGLADRPGAKVCFGGDRCSGVTVGVAHAAGPLDAGLPDERDTGARDSGLIEYMLNRRTEFLQSRW